MRIVLDTNILARATPGPASLARELVREVIGGPHVLLVSAFLLAELERVLSYERLRPVHGLDDEEIRCYVADVRSAAFIVSLPEGTPDSVVPNDPDDNPVIATAVRGQAEVICTLDKHFRHPDVESYCSSHGIRIVSDTELLSLLRRPDVEDAS